MNSKNHDVSIIIPTYNEQQPLPRLLQQLSRQCNINAQIIVVDGGSQDQSLAICESQITQHGGLCLSTQASRPVQMNLGAQQASAPLLLFLHADTDIDDDNLIEKALRHFHHSAKQAGHQRLAGHFSLRFYDTQGCHPQGFYFYAAKTSLNRADTINGDQGLLISKQFFNTINCFDTRLHYMEDAKLSTKIFQFGEWITLPGVIQTSARRFISEGLTERQILNSFLCNFNHINLPAFFTQAFSAYRSQSHTSRLRLRPFLDIIHRIMRQQGIRQALVYWYRTGSYVADNAWQLAFLLDCRRHFKQGDPAINVNPRRLIFFDHYCSWFFKLSVVSAITGILTCIWFYGLRIKYR